MRSRSLLFLPFGAVLIALFAVWQPERLAGYDRAIVPMLGVVMFSMGITLRLADFVRVFDRPVPVLSGLLLQYTLMPLIAWLLVKVLGLPLMLATGLILIGACPGGTASNVICFLARANVALSISLTALSTLLAVFLTPLITFFYVDAGLDVPVVKMMKNLFVIIILPVTAGVLINTFYAEKLVRIKSYLPTVSVLSILFIIGVIVAKNQAQVLASGLLIATAVVLHNVLGLVSGYTLSKLLRFDEADCRTIAIEVGMQNSGLAVVLANQYFTALAALPGALFSIWHNVSGAILAVCWSGKDET